MPKLFLTLVVFASVHFCVLCHPIKMSTGKLTYDRESKKIILVINFFVDDFGTHLRKTYRQPAVDFENPTSSVRDLVKDYVSKKVTIKINGVNKAFALESLSKLESNVVQAKFSIAAPIGFQIDVLEIYNELLFEAFKDQVNIFYVDLEGKGEARVFRFLPGDAYTLMKLDFVCR